MPRTIVHLDADAFYASVEQAADTRLRGKPVAVGGEKRGIIASASYEARKFGVYTPMPTVRARKLCPKLIVLPGDFDRYEDFSRWMFSYAYDFTPDVEITSIDEGYFDLTGSRKSPVEIADTIRKAIGQSLKITVSEGIGANKLISQIASKLNKPAAFEEVCHGYETKFLNPLPNRWLPGVGPKAANTLNAAGLARIGQIAETPLDFLHVLMGSPARQLKEFANGIDERPLIPVSAPAKSFGHQETFGADQTDESFIEATLKRMADDLMATVRAEGRSVRTLTVKVRYNDMGEDQASDSLQEPTDLETDIYGRITVLLKRAWKRRVSIRMVSLKLSNVYGGIFRAELSFDQQRQRYESQRRLAGAVDELRQRNGTGIIMREHDFRLRRGVSPPAVLRPASLCKNPPAVRATHYLPLNVQSYYSFLNSTLSVRDVVNLAKEHGLPAMALTDDRNLHGAVEFVLTAKEAGIKPILGARVKIGGLPALLYAESLKGYHNLCSLLSIKGELGGKELAQFADGLIAVSCNTLLARFFPKRFYFALASPKALASAPSEFPAVPAMACRYGLPKDHERFKIVQSIRTLTLLEEEHADKILNGKLHFRSPAEIGNLFADDPRLIAHSNEIAERCNFELPFGKPQFPAFAAPGGMPSKLFLRKLVLEGLSHRYGSRAEALRPQIEEELSIISKVGYEEYFLVVWSILQDCREQGIEWITRGSAADSLVCYCLGISGVCPIRFALYFKRFLNEDRMALNKLPDIDIDFPHDRKDDVIDLIFKKYGSSQAAAVGGFSTFQARSAFAEVAKVLGVGERDVRKFTDRFPWTFGNSFEAPGFHIPKLIELLRSRPECRDLPLDEEPYKTALETAQFLDGFPRYPKMHPCGIVLSRQPVRELTPTFISNKGYSTTHYDMDAVEVVGLVKIDVLAQGGLAVMRDAKAALEARGIKVDLEGLEPWEDPAIWEMIASGGARAVHHIESPAMTTLCRMCNVRDIDGLIAIVSVIRPGAANEQKKLKFTRRYQGMEPVTYADPSLEECLKSTFGLVVYEEHILQICEAFTGITPGRADVLRRALVKENTKVIAAFREEFAQAARARGHAESTINEVWDLISGFSGYAFCRAHSTAYGVEAYQAGWLKKYHPLEFMAAVLSNGKGFYNPLVYVLECHRLGITLLPPSLHNPGPAFVRDGNSIRIPVRYIKGLTTQTSARIIAEHDRQPFRSLPDFAERVNPSREEMELMLRVGVFDHFGKTRTAQFWEYQFLDRRSAKAPGQLSLLPPAEARVPQTALEEPDRAQRLEWEAEAFGFPAQGHPLELHNHIAWDTYCHVKDLEQHVGQQVTLCGLIIEERIHNQATGEPMKFMTLADWTGMVETELFASTYRTYGLATVRYPVLEIEGRVEAFENGCGFTLRAIAARRPRFTAEL